MQATDFQAAPLAAVARAVGKFFGAEARKLPWRTTQDPYKIWVSEIMLQQTRVETVVPRYIAFLQRYPSVTALAAASAADVCEAWSGLGYYRRARHLHAGAVVVERDFGGELPRTAAQLMRLPGIGRYTAGAIASLAFGERVPLVDGNVARVLSRVLALEAHLGESRGQKALWAAASALVAASGRNVPAPGVLNEGLIELGATVCTPRKPQCPRCPVNKYCEAYAQGVVHAYPPVAPRAPQQALAITYALCRTEAGVWLTQRGLHGLWAGQWEPPSSAGDEGREALVARRLRLTDTLATVTHELTHRKVTAVVYGAKATEKVLEAQGLVPWADPFAAPLSALARKALRAALSEAPSKQLTLGLPAC